MDEEEMGDMGCIIDLFVTYGDDRYAESRERMVSQAMCSGLCKEAQAYNLEKALELAKSSPQTLQVLQCAANAFKNLKGDKMRGGGYWLWKPLVLRDALDQLQPGEVLLYADAGCSIMPREDIIAEGGRTECLRKISILRSDGSPPLDAPALPRSRKHGRYVYSNLRYCRLACAQQFAKDVDAFMHSVQVEANRILIVKNADSVAFAHEWAEAALAHPDLFMDAVAGKETHQAEFTAHRHDQAVFSALLFNRGWKGSEWSFVTADRARHGNRSVGHRKKLTDRSDMRFATEVQEKFVVNVRSATWHVAGSTTDAPPESWCAPCGWKYPLCDFTWRSRLPDNVDHALICKQCLPNWRGAEDAADGLDFSFAPASGVIKECAGGVQART
eukprot:TRINITY_DN16593_c0_g1_i1.p1 TRINITY_DN16593_c0_g1~~TRINITY_DN16593_c0_g1_i1.p1  ORF type:complete len:387 (-),score=38.21 TRINITY_DN16593_c0_g1_i1:160-1320(-)